MNYLEALIAQKLTGGSGNGSPVPPIPSHTDTNTGNFTPAQDTYTPEPINVGEEWDHMVIWSEGSSLIGRRNIAGATLWKKANNVLAYKVMYTNIQGTSFLGGQHLSGGSLFSVSGNTLSFGADVSYGVYAAGTTYKWTAWKEGS